MIHIIYRGKGWLVFVLIFLDSLAANLITNELTGSELYWNKSKLPLAASFVVSSLLCAIIGHRISQDQTRVLVDRASGESVELKPVHDLFFIPLKWWPSILLLIAVGLAASEHFR